MKQNKIKDKDKFRGEEGFNSYYQELFLGRWDNLRQALLKDTSHASLTFPDCETYFLDPASICAALCLPSENAEDVLDLCAAPGGKTLVICANLPDSANLTSNERSPERKNRLSKVVSESLPQEISSRVKVTCSDGATLCQRETKKYQSILLDAPCSSERHVLKDPKYLNIWSPSRLKTMSMEQWALISSAWRLLDENGFLLYATCALSPKENDEIISRLLKKFPDAKKIDGEFLKATFEKNIGGLRDKKIVLEILEDKNLKIEDIFAQAEKTEHGFHILPDRCGYGPLYFSLIKKIRTSLENGHL